ncbi:glycoside hydrolase domain-containing protein [Paractinoplanes rhizophilus]|uniref:Glycoside hydrolase domain-containing protein n=1 Tax=Paractinoplanes rhizophilus TaxID=1416877 RepID=A0ABW2I315_9ACTN|nr:glycoside hydrolase domain-containing protein [Actinoplanes sp.]
MADEMVRRAQLFINTTYEGVPGIPQLDVDGKTGWATMYALTRALQHELGITALSNNFGPATLAALEARFPVLESGAPGNVVRIVQSGLYCKGYDGGDISGLYDERTAAGVADMKTNMGVAGVYPRGVVPKVFKALLTMDAYVLIEGGEQSVRSVQQWMNARYVNRRNFFVVPCDGHFSRDVQKALMLAIQFELGMSDDVANGVFGPGTQSGLKANTVRDGSTGVWVQLFSAAMLFNRRAGVSFISTFTSALASAVRSFQDFVKLPVNGTGDYRTWASLLVSTGDATRKGTALDCVTEITTARARALRSAGYRIVGRYLCNVAGTSLNKMIQPWELETTSQEGLRVFPIYQTYGGEAGYFHPHQGTVDALDAINWARYHGFGPATRIYFAVDYDAVDADVTSNIIPHFRAIKETVEEYSPYLVGVYGARNVCSRVAAAGLTSASFVSDMSTGFSGNLGYPLPTDWAFDQIATVTVGSGDGAIEIDNNIASGRDAGQSSFQPDRPEELVDVDFDAGRRPALLADVRAYLESLGIPEKSTSGLWQSYTTTEAFDIVLKFDKLMTSLSQRLRMRKALIQVPIMWEIRHFTKQDLVSDDFVRSYHKGLPGVRDCSTGLGQIFAATAIAARNYSIRHGFLSGVQLDAADDDDIWQVWQRLNSDPIYNIGTVPHVHIWGADDVGAPRPSLTYSQQDTLKVLIRYQGTDSRAEEGGRQRLGLYSVFESHNAALRAQ